MQSDEELRTALHASLEHLAVALLGKPSKLSTKSQVKWGLKGSLSLSCHGPKRGSWYNHEAGLGGGPLQLIVYVRGCSYLDAKQWASEWLGLSVEKRNVYTGAHPAAAMLARLLDDTGQNSDEAGRIAKARGLWEASVPVSGTLGESYLIQHRGIQRPPHGWPDAVRYHAKSRALIVGATLADGTVQATQCVFLTADGAKIGPEEAARRNPPAAKQTQGVLEGAAVRLLGDLAGGPVMFAEGPETGLSVWTATGAETWIALGSMRKLHPPSGRQIVVCCDDDARDSQAAKAITQTMTGWRRAGMNVASVTPWLTRRFDKSDFNDLIRINGAKAVKDVITAVLNPNIAASNARSRKLPADIRRALTANVAWLATAAVKTTGVFADEGFWRNPITGHPVALGHRIDVGVGKSVIARAVASQALAMLRYRGDHRTIAFAVPTHQLADEQVAAFNALRRARRSRLVAAVWRGRAADDPQAAGQLMCRNPDAVRDAIDAGMSVQSAACHRMVPEVGEFKCAWFDQCGYQRQRKRKADIWFVPHQALFIEKPDAIGSLLMLTVDEAIWRAGLEGVGNEKITLALDALDKDDDISNDPGATARLRFLRQTILGTLRKLPNGAVPCGALRATGLTAESAGEAIALEWQRKIDISMFPGMTAQARRKAAEAGAGNHTIRRTVMMWTALGALLAHGGPEASGWARIDSAASEHGSARVIVLKGRKPIAKGWGVPTLLIDANLNPDLIRPWWPEYVHGVDEAALTPHQRTRQDVSRSYGKNYFGQTGTVNSDEIRRGHQHLRETSAIANRAVMQVGERGGLVIANKGVEAALPSVWKIPPGVSTAHFNAVAGRDVWGGVGSLVTIGSTNASPNAVEELAEAVTGAHVPPLAGWYERHVVSRETTSGPMHTEAERHPHSIAEAIRWQIREGEVIQAVGRARGINRTVANPVDVLILGDMVLPFPVEPVNAIDLDASHWDMMLAAGGVALESPTHAAICCPDLWPNSEAAKQAFYRARSVTFPYKKILIGDCHPPLSRAEYQLAKAGSKPVVAWFLAAVVPVIEAWLTARLGTLAKCQVTVKADLVI